MQIVSLCGSLDTIQGDQGGPLICDVGGRTDVVVGIGRSIFSSKFH